MCLITAPLIRLYNKSWDSSPAATQAFDLQLETRNHLTHTSLFAKFTHLWVFWMSQYSNLTIISWIQSTAGVPIAFAALAAAAHQEIASDGFSTSNLHLGMSLPSACSIEFFLLVLIVAPLSLSQLKFWVQNFTKTCVCTCTLQMLAPGLQLLAKSRDVSLQLLGNIQKLAAAGCSQLTAAVPHFYNL